MQWKISNYLLLEVYFTSGLVPIKDYLRLHYSIQTNSKICPLAKSCKGEHPSEFHMQLYAEGSLLKSTEHTAAFPESPPIFKLHCVENFAHRLKKLKSLQNKLYYKIHLCDSFLKRPTHRGL